MARHVKLEAAPNFFGQCVMCGEAMVRYVRPSRQPPRYCPECRPKSLVGVPKAPEHIAKAKRFGPDHHAWKGDAASVRTGRTRAERMYPDVKPCERCGERGERHHRDENTLNNAPANIAWLCRRCHMSEDGRLAAFSNLNRRVSDVRNA
jgi:hypothetical protein